MNTTKNNSDQNGSPPFNILFTCAGRRVALIRTFRQALDELGLSGRLVGTDITASAPALRLWTSSDATN